jgi:serine/threonine protein kinase
VKDYDVFEDEGRLYIFMEHCAGGELLDAVEKQGNISEQLASDVFRQILEGLKYCHSQSIIHKSKFNF